MTFARHVLAYLEDRRVLYAPWNLEIPEHCIDSILEIRHFLTDQLGHLDDKDEDIAPHLPGDAGVMPPVPRRDGTPHR